MVIGMSLAWRRKNIFQEFGIENYFTGMQTVYVTMSTCILHEEFK